MVEGLVRGKRRAREKKRKEITEQIVFILCFLDR